jgi:hypothetical protein
MLNLVVIEIKKDQMTKEADIFNLADIVMLKVEQSKTIFTFQNRTNRKVSSVKGIQDKKKHVNKDWQNIHSDASPGVHQYIHTRKYTHISVNKITLHINVH